MRGQELGRLAAALAEPVRRFVRDARVRVALVVNGSGQVLAQHGFTGRFQVMNVAALAAAAHASARALGELAGAGRWSQLHHAGRQCQLVLAPFTTPAAELVLVAIFDDDSSAGLVRLFCDRLAAEVAALPEFQRAAPPAAAETFDAELDAGLDQLFSPAGAGRN